MIALRCLYRTSVRASVPGHRECLEVRRHATSGERGAGRGGRIIITTSGTDLFGTVGQANYGAAEAGIVSLTTGAGGQAAGASPAPARSQPRRPAGRVLGQRAGGPGGQVRLGQAGLLRLAEQGSRGGRFHAFGIADRR